MSAPAVPAKTADEGDLDTPRGALFSPCRVYRYGLWRTWGTPDQASVLFIGLNPSTADAIQDDPTIRRCRRFAKDWGCGRLVVANLFALRSTDPRALKGHADPVGPETNHWILRLANQCTVIVAAWGVHGSYRDRSQEVRRLLALSSCRLDCLGLTRDGYPRHPLYLRADTPLVPWSYSQ